MSASETVTVNGKSFVVDYIYLDGPDEPPYYGCGILPLRRYREDLIRDIELSQGPEWRNT